MEPFLFLILIVVVLLILSKTKKARGSDNFSHWYTRIPGMKLSTNEFYQMVETEITSENVERIKIRRVNISEGGVLSANREYLEVVRDEHVFHLCAAPFGNGFFVSYWIGTVTDGFYNFVLGLPIVGPLLAKYFDPETYYKIDVGLMFLSLTSSAVMQCLDSLTNTQGLKALSEQERKPVMRDFLK